MEEKHRFVSLADTGKFSVTELCTEFKVSRKTGHKWLRRYQAVVSVKFRTFELGW
jgi:transposase-like protein